jgi:hypothetical protein
MGEEGGCCKGLDLDLEVLGGLGEDGTMGGRGDGKTWV